MTSLRSALVLLVVALVAISMVSSAPSPSPKPGFLNKLKNLGQKALNAINPTLKCLSKAGAGDATLGWLKDCGQTKFYGKFALASCAATEYAPSDVKNMLKNSAACFKLG
ncbi:hypothetical protein ONE63_001910 [Megalurothrips usitatus]|uniref:Uncharacterized protein n=1 Tax=Megalurothrips usitatus TaxID=439358 RepID=A0AAV7X9T4_9NEOP|nr:hypothetical protein ONE63_001910 [Megalurothrips usitatus]